MKKKNGFTLIELLAVIVILAIILVIAVPKIIDTIENSRKSSMQDAAQLIATQAEKEYLVRTASGGDTTAIDCAAVAKLNDNDYDSCTITWSTTNTGEVEKVELTGKDGGKFDGYTCEATSASATCTKA